MATEYPDTQTDAWAAIQAKLPECRRRVLYCIDVNRGLPLWAVCIYLGLPVNRVSGRITELRKEGLLKDSGRRLINPDSGYPAIVWVAVKPGETIGMFK